MKRLFCVIFWVWGVVSGVWARNAVNPETVELRPIPCPKKLVSDMDKPVSFDASVRVLVACGESDGVKWLKQHFALWYGEKSPQVVAVEGIKSVTDIENCAQNWGIDLPKNEEAYAIHTDTNGVRMVARTLAGVRWAAYSLRPLVIARRGTFKTDGYVVPTLSMVDAPHLAFRAIHLCWIPEMRATQIERAIRLAALMKFNYCVLEPWGMYRSEKHPWWGWPNGKMTKAEVKRLVALGRDLGITLIPQINAFGHGSSARSCTLKHAILDLQPEYEPLFEPGGWNWCLTNPETQRVLRDLIVEMHEDFGNPPFFHLGCDEAQPPSCPECRKRVYGQLVCEHITGLVEFLRSRNARAMMWHDMLLKRDDPRWRGFVACGDATTSTLAQTLPKDVIICDWQYSYGNEREARKDWPTMGYFKAQGFPVVGCPWLNFNAMRPMADYLKEQNCFGYLQTTWHHLRSNDWRRIYVYGASAAWGSKVYGSAPQFDTNLALAFRLVGHDMKLTDPIDTGDVNYQMPPTWWIDN